MYRFQSNRRRYSYLIGILSGIAAMAFLVGCTGETSPTAPGPILLPVSNPAPTRSPLPASVSNPSPTGSSLPASVLDPTPTAALVTAGASSNETPVTSWSTTIGIPLELWSPLDGTETKTGVVRLLGKTRVDAAVAVNGIPKDVPSDGTFQRDLQLQEGANLVEVVSTDLLGQSSSKSVAVFSTSSTAGIPLSLFYPPDGLEVSEPKVTVIGGTRQDAVVGVNGIPVELNALGIFSTDVYLEPGANLIEVVTTDIQERINFQTVAVFYLR